MKGGGQSVISTNELECDPAVWSHQEGTFQISFWLIFKSNSRKISKNREKERNLLPYLNRPLVSYTHYLVVIWSKWLFSHPLNEQFLSTYYVPGTAAIGTWETSVNKTDPCPQRTYILEKRSWFLEGQIYGMCGKWNFFFNHVVFSFQLPIHLFSWRQEIQKCQRLCEMYTTLRLKYF